MIFCVGLEVFGEVVDAFAENRHLNFWRAGIRVVGFVAADEFRLAVFAEHLGSSTYAPVLPVRTGAPYMPGNSLVEQVQYVTPEQPRDAKRRRRGSGRQSRPVRRTDSGASRIPDGSGLTAHGRWFEALVRGGLDQPRPRSASRNRGAAALPTAGPARR